MSVTFAGPVLSQCLHNDEMSGWLELDRIEGEGTGVDERVDMRKRREFKVTVWLRIEDECGVSTSDET